MLAIAAMARISSSRSDDDGWERPQLQLRASVSVCLLSACACACVHVKAQRAKRGD
jgi:hypothetical protein